MIDMTRNTLYHLSNLNAENARISYQMSTEKNQERGSEDSLLYNDILRIQDKLRVNENLQLQLTHTGAINDSSDTAMSSIKKSIGSIKSDLMKGLNDGMDRNDKLALASNLSGIRETMVDLMGTEVDGEYVFTGSNTTIPTISKDVDFDKNGKITYNGDGFLRKVAVQEGSYRDRGITGYDVAFYSASTAITGQDLTVADNERVIDGEGYEWKLSKDRLKLQRYDKNGDIFYPPVEIGVQNTPATSFSVDLGVGANTDANGDFAIKIDGQNFVYTADGTKSASDIYTDLKTQITSAGYKVSALNGDKFTISSTSDINVDVADQNLATSVTETNTNYTMKITNEVEASGDTQAVSGSVKATIPNQITTSTGEKIDTSSLQFESKHNYFDDLNVIINALNGYSTNLDGTKADVMSDDGVSDTLRIALGQTTNQFNATNIGHGELGGRNKIFEQADTSLQAQITHYDILMKETNGADMTKLAMESKALELTYTSIYSTIAKMNQMSLVSYLN